MPVHCASTMQHFSACYVLLCKVITPLGGHSLPLKSMSVFEPYNKKAHLGAYFSKHKEGA